MNVALNLMNTLNPSGNSGAENSTGPAVFLDNSKVNKTGFKEMLLSEPALTKDISSEKALKKLKQLLEMKPEDMMKELKQFDKETLSELGNLLSLPFSQLFQQLKSLNMEVGSDKDSLKILEDSIKGLKTILAQELTANDLPIQFDTDEIAEPETVVKDETNSLEDTNLNNKPKLISNNGDKLTDNNQNLDDSSKLKDAEKNSNTSFIFKDEKTVNSQTKTVSVNLDEVNVINNDKNNEKNSDLKFANLKDSKNTNQAIIRNLQNNNVNNPDQETIVKDEFVLERAGTTNQKTKDIKFWNMNQLNQQNTGITDDIITKNQPEKNGQNSQFNDLMGQSSQQNTGFKVTDAAKIAVDTGSDRAGVIEQITEQIKVKYQSGKNQINIQLEPESLGKVKVQLKVENGEVLAKFIVDSQQIKNYLDQNLNALRSNLVSQGFNVNQIHVESSDINYKEQFNSQQEFQQQQGFNDDQQEKQEQGFFEDNFNQNQLFTEDLDELLEQEGIELNPTMKRWMMYSSYYRRMDILA